MMELTKEKAIELHREMWSYMATETLKQGRVVGKLETIRNYLKMDPDNIEWWCFCCHYAYGESVRNKANRCDCCPLVWPNGECIYEDYSNPENDGLYVQWLSAKYTGDVELAAKLAQQIAELPVKEG